MKWTGDYKHSSENPYFYLWIVASVVSSVYAYTWDVKMDWGLFDQKAGDNKFLREEIVYPSAVSTPLQKCNFCILPFNMCADMACAKNRQNKRANWYCMKWSVR